MPKSRRRPLPAACEPCRKRKTKCDGFRPCGTCESRSKECVYETSFSSETRVQAIKRRLSELQEHKSAFEQVYELLQERPDKEVSVIIRRIRTGTVPEVILRQVHHGDLLLQLHTQSNAIPRHDTESSSDMSAPSTESESASGFGGSIKHPEDYTRITSSQVTSRMPEILLPVPTGQPVD